MSLASTTTELQAASNYKVLITSQAIVQKGMKVSLMDETKETLTAVGAVIPRYRGSCCNQLDTSPQ